MSTIFFHSKRNSFYHRSSIPKKLRGLLKGRREVWRSLDTADKDTASVRSVQWDARVAQLFHTLRKDGARMTEAERGALVEYWLEREIDESEDFRALNGPFSDEDRDTKWLILHDQLDAATGAFVSCDYRRVEREADDLLKAAGLPALDHDGADFGRLCRRLLEAKIDYISTEMDRWEGKRHTTTTTNHHHRPTPSPSTKSPVSGTVQKTPTGPMFSKVVDLFFKENPRVKRSEAQSRAEFKKFLALLGGDRPVSAITREDGLRYKQDIREGRKLALITTIKHLTMLSGVFKWCERQGYIPDGSNPVKGLEPNQKAAKKLATRRKAFTDAQLVTVFGSPKFMAQKTTRPERYWIALLLLFQICRREEAAQLNVADIGEDNGIPFINITDEGADQGLKNEGSKRRLPIHSSLVRLGFLDFVASVKKAGHTRLFSNLKKGTNNFGDAVGKFFSRLVTLCGLDDPALVLHSLRHGGITKLHAAGCPHNVAEVLAGHAAAGVHGQTYVHRDQLPLSLLKEGLEKLRYDNVVKVLTA